MPRPKAAAPEAGEPAGQMHTTPPAVSAAESGVTGLPASLLTAEQLCPVVESLLFVPGRPLQIGEHRRLLPELPPEAEALEQQNAYAGMCFRRAIGTDGADQPATPSEPT